MNLSMKSIHEICMISRPHYFVCLFHSLPYFTFFWSHKYSPVKTYITCHFFRIDSDLFFDVYFTSFSIDFIQCFTISMWNSTMQVCTNSISYSSHLKTFYLRTNCTVAEKCWHEALAYRSSELIEQLFSFSSLSIHVDTYQRHHTNEVCV